MIDGIIIVIEALGGLVHCIEKRRQDRGRRVCNACLPIRLASDAPYRNTQTKMTIIVAVSLASGSTAIAQKEQPAPTLPTQDQAAAEKHFGILAMRIRIQWLPAVGVAT